MNTEILLQGSTLGGGPGGGRSGPSSNDNNNQAAAKWEGVRGRGRHNSVVGMLASGLSDIHEEWEGRPRHNSVAGLLKETSKLEGRSSRDSLSEIAEEAPKVGRARHNSIVGLVKNWGTGEDKRGRRKSWHSKLSYGAREKLAKQDRKRKEGVVVTPTSPYLPGKRRSWWNIFVPEQTHQRSRRASTDVSQPSFHPILYTRSKSRSVDHGVSPPFGLEFARNKVDDRFDSIHDSDGDMEKEKKKVTPPINTIPYTVQARDTLNSVAARFDITPSELRKLNRLASSLIFPGQLLLVPEKKTSTDGDDQSEDSQSITEPEPVKDMLDTLRPASPKPSHTGAESGVSGARGGRRFDIREARFLKINVRHITDGQGVVCGVLLVTPNAVMFDPNVSDPLVIEHGPESYGVIAPMDLVVNAVIYYDIAHMRVCDRETDTTNQPRPEIYYHKQITEAEQREEGMESQSSPGQDSLLVKDETFPELVAEKSSDEDSVSSSQGALGPMLDRPGHAFPKAFDRDLVTPVMNQDTTPTPTEITPTVDTPHISQLGAMEGAVREQVASGFMKEDLMAQSLDQQWSPSVVTPANPIQGGEQGENLFKSSCHDSGIDMREANVSVDAVTKEKAHKTSSVSFSIEGKLQDCDSKSTDSHKTKMLKRLSYPLSWMEGTFVNESKDEKDSLPSLPTSADSQQSQSSSVFSKVFSRRSSVGTFIRNSSGSLSDSEPRKPPPPKLDYRSMVSVEDMPELFVSFDKLIPRPARSCEDPPLYLRLRMGKPLNRKIPKSTAIMSYGKKKMKPEYWFSVPRNRVDELYNFLHVWVPHLYCDLEAVDVTARGYELVEDDTELWDQEELENDDGIPGTRRGEPAFEGDDLTDLTKESWEVLSMSEELRRALYASSLGSLDMDLFLPELVGATEILTEEHRKQLCRHLPARAEGYLWTLVFSTSQHGFSLNTLYRKMGRLESPILLVVQDTDNNVFGAITSCSLKVSDHFYGTGESLLFRFNHSELTAYQWTGDNMYFIKGNNESLAIGAGDGKFGLWLDGDLYQGRSEHCTTYGNPPLASQEDFVVKTLECWAFV